MRLEKMGAFHQTRLSFSRVLMRRMARENWQIKNTVWDLDSSGYGVAVITVCGPKRNYSLVCYSQDLAPEDRSDRSIATAWDATFTLFDGIPTTEDIERLSLSVPKQEAGRVSKTELTLARANKSIRVFDHVVEHLATGLQPDPDLLHTVGYLMRTTAVYGSGKFGTAAWEQIADRSEMGLAFQAEMLTVYLVRIFTIQLVEHIATARGGSKAVKLDVDLRRKLGVGNSTGLGMAPFLIAHQALIHNWMLARETAFARVRALETTHKEIISKFKKLVKLSLVQMQASTCKDPTQNEKQLHLVQDLKTLSEKVSGDILNNSKPWDHLAKWAEEALSLEGQELLLSLIIEPHGELVDDLADLMCADEGKKFGIDGTQSLQEVLGHIKAEYSWALRFNLQTPCALKRAWYTSENKGEPRLANSRSDIPDPDRLEMPLSIARDIQAMTCAIQKEPANMRLGDFLLQHPNYRHLARRIQRAHNHPYGEVRNNLLAEDMLPLSLLRCKLSFFGATRFDPKSDRWLQISLFSGAPFPEELGSNYNDDWIYMA